MVGKQETKNTANSCIRQGQDALRLYHHYSKKGDLEMCRALLIDTIAHLQVAHGTLNEFLGGGENGKGAEGTKAESEQLLSEGAERSDPGAEATDAEEATSSDEGQDLDAWQEQLLSFRTHLASEQYQIAELAIGMWAGDEWKDLRLADGSYDKYEPLVKWLSEAAVDALRDYCLKVAENVIDERIFSEDN